MSQKTMLFKLFILLLAVGLIPKTNLLASGICSSSSDGDDVIIVRCHDGQLTGAPRVPSSTRIEAYYDADLASVCAYLVNSSTWVKTTTWRKRCALVHHFRWPWNRTCRYMSNFEVVMVIGDSDSII